MGPDLWPSVVLISSKTTANNFGTGFIVEQTGMSTRVLTCRHVIVGPRSVGGVGNARIGRDEAQKIEILKCDGREVIGSEDVEDFAVLDVTPPLNGPALALTTSRAGDQVRLEGFSDMVQFIQRTPLDGTILRPAAQFSKITDLSIPAWAIELDVKNQLHPGYSGSPMVNAGSNAVLGMITGMTADGYQGLSYEIGHLLKLWPEASRLFLEERVMVLHAAEDKANAAQLLSRLQAEVKSPIGLYQWTGTTTDALMLSSCKVLLVLWSTGLQETGEDLLKLSQGRLELRKTVVPVSSPESPPPGALESIFSNNSWCKYDGPESCGRLVQAITGVNPFVPPAPRPLDPGEMTDIAKRFKKGLLTFVIGGGQSPEWDIVHRLITKLGLPDSDSYSYLPLDIAGSCYSFGRSIPQLDEEMEGCSPSSSLVELCTALCEVLQDASIRPERRTIGSTQPQLIMTTNFDLTLEVCLLKAGIPFLRVVNDRSGKWLWTTDFSSEFTLEMLNKTPEEIRKSVLLLESARIEDRLEDRVAGQTQNPITTLSLLDAKFVLYKLVGSADIDSSTILTSEQVFLNVPLLRTGKQTPFAIQKILNRTDSLFLGYGHLDQSFRVIQQLLPTMFGDTSRYFVQSMPGSTESDPLRKLESMIWAGLIRHRERDSQIKAATINADPSTFVSGLR